MEKKGLHSNKLMLHFEALRTLDVWSDEEKANETNDLEDYKVFLSDWIQSFNEESKQFASSEAQEMAKPLPTPNIFMTSLCCDVLEKLIPSFGSYSSVVQELHKQFVASIFVQKNVLEEEGCQTISTYNAFERRLAKQIKTYRQRRDAFVGQRRKILMQTKKHKDIFNSSIENWAKGVVGNTFRAWAQFVQAQKWQVKKIQLIFDHFWKPKDRLRWYFGEWCTYKELSKRQKLLANLERGAEECELHKNSLTKNKALLQSKQSKLPCIKDEIKQVESRLRNVNMKLEDLKRCLSKCKTEQKRGRLRCSAWQKLSISNANSILRVLKNKLHSYVSTPDIEGMMASDSEELDNLNQEALHGSAICLAWLKTQLLKVYNLNNEGDKFQTSLLRQKVVAAKDLSELVETDILLDLCRALPQEFKRINEEKDDVSVFTQQLLGSQKKKSDKEYCALVLVNASIFARNLTSATDENSNKKLKEMVVNSTKENEIESSATKIDSNINTVMATGLVSAEELLNSPTDTFSVLFISELMVNLPLIDSCLRADATIFQQTQQLKSTLSSIGIFEVEPGVDGDELSQNNELSSQAQLIAKDMKKNLSEVEELLSDFQDRYHWSSATDTVDNWTWEYLGSAVPSYNETGEEQSKAGSKDSSLLPQVVEGFLEELELKPEGKNQLKAYLLRNDVIKLHQRIADRYLCHAGEAGLVDLVKETRIMNLQKAETRVDKIKLKWKNTEKGTFLIIFLIDLALSDSKIELLQSLSNIHVKIVESGVTETLSKLTNKQKKKLFAFYLRECPNKKKYMTQKKWISFLEKSSLIKPGVLPVEKSKVIFQKSVRQNDTTMCFTEFCTAILVVAGVRYPDPFSQTMAKVDAILQMVNVNR